MTPKGSRRVAPYKKVAPVSRSDFESFLSGLGLVLLGRAPLLRLVVGSCKVKRLLQTNEVTGRTEGFEGLAFFLKLIFGVRNRLDGETDPTLNLIDLDDTGFDVVADLKDILDALHMLLAKLRDVNQTINIPIETDECSKGSDLGNRSRDLVSHLELAVDVGPRVVIKLLNSEGNALIFLIDAKNNSFDLVVLLEHFGRMIDLTSPRKVGDVDHAVDTLFEANECTISGEVAHLALDFLADRVTSLDLGPWILLELADPKRDLLLLV